MRDGLAYDPGNPLLLSRAAIHAAALRDYDRAAGYFRRFLERHPDDVAHKVGYAAVLLRLARFDEAERIVAEAQPALPDNLALRFTGAVLDFVRERPVDADRYWTRRTLDQAAVVASWLQNDREVLTDLMGPDDFARLGDHTLGAGTADHLAAIARHMETVLKPAAEADTAPAFAALDALANLGVHTLGIDARRADLAMAAGRGPEALARWRAVIERAPDWAHARLQYGFALLRMDHMSDAVDVLRHAREQADEPIVRFLLASALALDEQRDEARDLFNQLAHHHPEALRQWLGIDPRFDRAIRRMENYANLMRRIGVPPEMD